MTKLPLIGLVSLISFLVACSESPSNNPDGEPIQPTPVPEFALGGTVSGLNGEVRLKLSSDSLTADESLSVTENDTFTFINKLPDGAFYSVSIDSDGLPERQLCDVSNASAYIYGDRSSVRVNCADVVESAVRITVPEHHTLDGLRIVSNFSSFGGEGENPVSDSVTMKVFDDTVVALKALSEDGEQSGEASEEKILYLSYIVDADVEALEVNSESTAIAFILLEPTVINALRDRGLSASDVYTDLLAALHEVEAIESLADAIDKHLYLSASSHLGNPNGSFTPDLKFALQTAIDYIVTLPLASEDNAKFSLQKVRWDVEPANTDVALSFEKFPGDNPAISINATNSKGRYVQLTVSSDNNGLAEPIKPVMVRPNNSADIILPSGITSQAHVTVRVNGPGVLGDFEPEQLDAISEATAATAAYQYALPSLNPLFGLARPAAFNIDECLTEEQINSLIYDQDGELSLKAVKAGVNQLTQLKEEISEDQYFRAFSVVSSSVRARLLEAESLESSLLKNILECDKFGTGILLVNDPDVMNSALENISSILRVLNDIYLDSELDVQLNLFGEENVSHIANMLNEVSADSKWVMSNLLLLEVSEADYSGLVSNAMTEFSASCFAPPILEPVSEIGGQQEEEQSNDTSGGNEIDEDSSDSDCQNTEDGDNECENEPVVLEEVPCDITWEFSFNDGSEEAEGKLIERSFTNDGDAELEVEVFVNASNDFGAQASDSFEFVVEPITPKIELQNITGEKIENFASDTRPTPIPAGEALLGESESYQFVIANVGYAKLTVDDIISDNPLFTLSSNTIPMEINAGETATVEIVYNADNWGESTAVISVLSDDPSDVRSSYEFDITAKSYSGRWSVTSGQTIEQFIDFRLPDIQLPAGDRNILELVVYGGETGGYPLIAMDLFDFDITSAAQGNGTYSLLDYTDTVIMNGEEVQVDAPSGQLAYSDDLTENFQTKTSGPFASQQVSGEVVVTDGPGDNWRRAEFSFNVIPFTCIIPADCETKNVNGVFLFELTQ